MKEKDTSVGGSRRAFPATTWGLVSRLRQPQAGLEDLCRRYWKPVYRHIRIAWGKSNDDAKDLTQAFFTWLLDGEALTRYAPERAGFRTYLKTLLRHFLGHEEEAMRRLKRGGGVTFVDLDVAEGELKSQDEDPATVFDRTWIRDMIGRALDKVRKTCDPVRFRVYEAYELGSGRERPTYADLAGRFGLSWGEVKSHLYAVRELVRSELRAEVAETVSDPAALEEEWNAIFGS